MMVEKAAQHLPVHVGEPVTVFDEVKVTLLDRHPGGGNTPAHKVDTGVFIYPEGEVVFDKDTGSVAYTHFYSGENKCAFTRAGAKMGENGKFEVSHEAGHVDFDKEHNVIKFTHKDGTNFTAKFVADADDPATGKWVVEPAQYQRELSATDSLNDVRVLIRHDGGYVKLTSYPASKKVEIQYLKDGLHVYHSQHEGDEPDSLSVMMGPRQFSLVRGKDGAMNVETCLRTDDSSGDGVVNVIHLSGSKNLPMDFKFYKDNDVMTHADDQVYVYDIAND